MRPASIPCHKISMLIGFACLVSIVGPLHAQDRKLAAELLERVGVSRGVVSVLGDDAETVIDIAKSSELLLHVRLPGAEQVAEQRRRADELGFGIDRAVIEQGTFAQLPYASNMIDGLVTTQASGELLNNLKAAEVLRALRPGAVAIIGGQDPAADSDALKTWASAAIEDAQTYTNRFGTWIQFSKPVPQGIDEWSHWEKSPDNNPVSQDTVIKAPYMPPFMAGPFYIGMPSLTTAAGGRTFLAVGHIAHHPREWDGLNRLIARNGYNGTVLWERKLPEGYLTHRSAFIATKDTFHMIDGESCLLLDAATGKEMGRIRIPELEGEWKWMAIKDDVLYVLAGKPDGGVTTTKGDRTFGGWSWADLSKEYYPERFPGKRIPVGFGDTLAAYDLKSKKPLWLHKEETLIDSRGLAVRDGKLYLYCPDRHLRSLDLKTGELVWTNSNRDLLNLIEQPGKGLTSTPGWRTQTLVVATPEALIIQGQTRMNVTAVSTKDGYLLWTKRKVNNNPNAIYVDGKVVVGVGRGGTHVVIDPVSGEVEENLNFGKRACTRLTACADSFFVRGEGTLRFDRASKKVLVDGAQRPACNDGAMPAHGLLYLGPWQCDCNLSLIGNIAKCSAGDFQFDQTANSQRLEKDASDIINVAEFEVAAEDWPTYRSDNQRSSSTKANARLKAGTSSSPRWSYVPKRSYTPTAPVAAGGLIFSSGDDGIVRAINVDNGSLRWQFRTPGFVKYPPTIAEGRAYVGCGDGYVYCLEAATGRLLWRFQAAPVERHIMVYDRLGSTWPVGSGVLVEDGVAYFAAGIVDHDGTYVYALDAKTGEIKWQNHSSGHLSEELRKGVSVQGNLAIFRNQLLLAGGNQVSPAQFDLETGACLTKPQLSGQPRANNGRFVGVFRDKSAIVGGRILYSAPENVSTKGSFNVFTGSRAFRLNQGGVPPAWNDRTVALVNFKHGKLTCCDAAKVEQQMEAGYGDSNIPPRQRRWLNLTSALEKSGGVRWQTDMDQPNKFETVSIVTCPDKVVAAVKYQMRFRAQPQWFVVSFDAKSGNPVAQRELPATPLPDGLLVDRSGTVVVSMIDGIIVCFGG